jgi:predicted Zn-dependent protease
VPGGPHRILLREFPTETVRIGSLLVQLGRPEEAERYLREAIRRQPDDPRLQRKLRKLLEARDEAGKE